MQVKAKASSDGYIEAVAGVFRKTLVYGEHTLMTEFKLLAGHTLPAHSHPHEQTGYLISGHIILTVDGAPYDMRPGDSWIVLPNIAHSARIIEDSVVIEVFSPVREDYLP